MGLRMGVWRWWGVRGPCKEGRMAARGRDGLGKRVGWMLCVKSRDDP